VRKTLGRFLGVGKDMLKEDNRGACSYELINLGSSAVARHFVQCSSIRTGLKPVPLLEGVFPHETFGLLMATITKLRQCQPRDWQITTSWPPRL